MGSGSRAVTAVAERTAFGVLAQTQRHLLLLVDLEFHRREAGAFVRTVTVRLRLRMTAPAPPIRTGIERQDLRCASGNFGLLIHGASFRCVLPVTLLQR